MNLRGLAKLESQLHTAVLAGEIIEVRDLLLEKKVNPNALNKQHETPLLALARTFFENDRNKKLYGTENKPYDVITLYAIISLLIQAGANVNVKNQEKVTPLHFFAFNKIIVVIRLLLASGANKYAQDKSYNIPWEWARSNHQIEAEKLLGHNPALQPTISNDIYDTSLVVTKKFSYAMIDYHASLESPSHYQAFPLYYNLGIAYLGQSFISEQPNTIQKYLIKALNCFCIVSKYSTDKHPEIPEILNFITTNCELAKKLGKSQTLPDTQYLKYQLMLLTKPIIITELAHYNSHRGFFRKLYEQDDINALKNLIATRSSKLHFSENEIIMLYKILANQKTEPNTAQVHAISALQKKLYCDPRDDIAINAEAMNDVLKLLEENNLFTLDNIINIRRILHINTPACKSLLMELHQAGILDQECFSALVSIIAKDAQLPYRYITIITKKIVNLRTPNDTLLGHFSGFTVPFLPSTNNSESSSSTSLSLTSNIVVSNSPLSLFHNKYEEKDLYQPKKTLTFI
jgi:hypothetical protein